MSPKIKFESDWLKAEDNVFQDDHIKFVDVGVQDEKDGKPRWIFNVDVLRNGTGQPVCRKKFTLNKTNFEAIAEVYGENSDSWVGKEMRVNVMKVQNPSGGMVPAVRLCRPGVPGEA